MTIKIIQPTSDAEFSSYFHLRWELLRAPWGQPEGSETDEFEEESVHFMALDDDQTIAVARLQFNSESEAQIRYMAVARSHQRKGIGRDMIIAMETCAKKNEHKRVVLHAREAAVGFYQKLGYSIDEKSYLLFDQIQHFRMSKAL